MFSGKHKPFFAGTRYFFVRKTLDFFPQNARIRAVYTSI